MNISELLLLPAVSPVDEDVVYSQINIIQQPRGSGKTLQSDSCQMDLPWEVVHFVHDRLQDISYPWNDPRRIKRYLEAGSCGQAELKKKKSRWSNKSSFG